MISQFMRKGFVILTLLAAFATFTGCDKAEQALEKTDLGASADITKLISKAAEMVGGIKDIESAQAALPALKGVDVDLGKLVQKVSEMTPDQKTKLVGAVSKVLPQLEGAIDKVSAIPGVGGIVGPTLDSLKSKFNSLT